MAGAAAAGPERALRRPPRRAPEPSQPPLRTCAPPDENPLLVKTTMGSASMHSQKNRRRLDKKCKKIPVGRADLRPILPERQSVVIPAHGRLPGIVVRLPQVPTGGLIAELIS